MICSMTMINLYGFFEPQFLIQKNGDNAYAPQDNVMLKHNSC